jgi:hypothetical protein
VVFEAQSPKAAVTLTAVATAAPVDRRRTVIFGIKSHAHP